MVDLLPDARRRRRSIGLFALALFVVVQIALVAGSAIGFRRYGYTDSLASLFWLLPGLILAVCSKFAFERWRGVEFSYLGGEFVFFLAFFPAIPIGDWLQDAVL